MRPTAAVAPRKIVPWYAVTVSILFVLGLAHPALQVWAWGAMGLVSAAMILIGPVLTGSTMIRSWWVAGACATAAWALGWTHAMVTPGNAFEVSRSSLPIDVTYYVLTAVLALAVVTGRASTRSGMGEVDPLVLFTMLIVMVGTLLMLVMSDDPSTSGHTLAVFIIYLVLVMIVVVILGRQLWRHRTELGQATWQTLVTVQTMLVASIGALAANQLNVPGWLDWLPLVWLAGYAMLGVAAGTPAKDVGVAGLGAVRRLSPASWAMIVILLVGPPAEIVNPSLANLVTMLVIVMVCLLLAEMRRRVLIEQAIRSAATALAAATDAPLMLDSTLAAAATCAGRGQRIVVCAAGPGGLHVAATDPDDSAIPAALRDLTPVQYADLILGEQPHVMVVSPPSTAPIAIGIAESRRSLGNWIGSLELLAAQAGLALNRIMLTTELSQRASEAYFQTLAANTADLIVTLDDTGHIRYASPSARAAFGRDVAGEPFAALVGAHNARAMCDGLADRPPTTPLRWQVPAAHGGDTADRRAGMETEVRIADLRTDPTVRGVVVTLRDVTAEARLNRRLRDLAYHDQLTRLGNLAWFTDRFEQAVASGMRSPVVLMADVDGFTELNHLHGRVTGDLVLVAVARRLAGVGGVVARVDGGRFVVLTQSAGSTEDDMADLARRLQSRLSRPVDFGSEQIAVTVVVGAACVDHVTDVNEALRRTSLAVAEAKSDPRPPWRSYRAAMLDAAVDRDNLTRDLVAAIRRGDLELRYQPVVDLPTGRVCGFEALTRWQHPGRGDIPPNVFIPLAEETGLIVPLGRWVLRQAVRDAAWLRERAGRRLCVSVNVAAQQLAEPGFHLQVAGELAAAGLPPQALCLEITERSVVRSGSRTMDMLHSLKGLSVPLAIDDFGTGHSALSYLLDMPFDTLKIDMSFLAEITTSTRHAQLVHGITRIADAAGLSVVAEGIESEGQQEVLVDAGCTRGQGFFYSPAVPLAEAANFLRRDWNPHRAA